VRELNLPFRDAHHVTGRAVAMAEAKGCELAELALSELQELDPAINEGIFDVLSVENSIKSRTSFGGTAPENVLKQVAFWRAKLGN